MLIYYQFWKQLIIIIIIFFLLLTVIIFQDSLNKQFLKRMHWFTIEIIF